MPQSAIVVFARAAGTAAASSSASQREFAMSAGRAADDELRRRRTPGISPMLATSWPCAMTTSGVREASEASVAAPPAGKSMWAKITSGRRRRARGDGIADEPEVLGARCPAMVDGDEIDFVAEPLELAPDGTRKLPRSGSSGPGPHLGQELDPHDRG